MHPVVDELRKAREARKMSLSDIAASTLINIRMLEAIEEGNFNLLPQAYVRAFLREYASTVGLDPDTVLEQYQNVSRKREENEPAPVAHPPIPYAPADERSTSSRTITVGAIVIVAALIAVTGWYALRPEPEAPVQEIPFQNVVKENEQRLDPDVSKIEASPKPSIPVASHDSLTLMATTSDTVWMQLVIDQQQPLEYLFRPNAKRLWKAHDRFLVTLGNAGGVNLTLNDKPLGPLGKPGVVVRDVELTRDSLKHD